MMYWVEGHNSRVLGTLPPRAIFIFLWIRLSIIHKTHLLSSLFFKFHIKKLACFHEPQIGRIYPNISLSDSLFRLTNFKRKIKFELPNYLGLWTINTTNALIKNFTSTSTSLRYLYRDVIYIYIYMWSLFFDFSVAQCSIRRSRARCIGR